MKYALVGLDKDLLDALGGEVVAIFDPAVRDTILGVPVIGGDDAWPAYRHSHPDVTPLLAIDPPALRRALATKYGDCASFIAPTADVSKYAKIGTGVVIQRRCFISTDVRLDEGVRINVGTQIHHDCVLGSFTTVAPGALIMGSVTIGRDVYLGAGAVVLQGLAIGDGAVIGAGAIVTKPVPAKETVAGVPARILASTRSRMRSR